MSLNIFIFSTGTELTAGKSTDTNSGWLANELLGLGYRTRRFSILPDSAEEIRDEILRCSETEGENLILMTGGLGPTEDDYTLEVVIGITGKKAVVYEPAYEKLKIIAEGRGIEFQDIFPVSQRQTMYPAGASVIHNEIGIAPGFLVRINDHSRLAAFPGVPREMKAMFTDSFIPLLKREYQPRDIFSFSRIIWGVGESVFQEKFIKNHHNLMAERKVEWGVAAKSGHIKVTFRSEDEYSVEKLKSALEEEYYPRLGDDVFQFIHDFLTKKKYTVSSAESCTGGLFSKLVTDRPGSSGYFIGSIVGYHDDVKMKLLGLKKETLEKFGSVSEEAAVEMSEGVQSLMNTHYSVAITGIAGPTGETQFKKIGLVYIAVKSHKHPAEVHKYQLNVGRDNFREYVSNIALFHLYQRLKKDRTIY
ncbi:MAG TPA: nicotinamide-nucleotide amidohydrolase family protein [Leptospiraceae bacterium]|nr:nicotinamide-nucleotide amidohydrolase family protein [Leptospiraceae bacterium]HMZ58072.1 nicotinamide-nucleotide amidohydrolase family protein [Leptospiraceae bacterium]HNF13723.1 nicotinamide-nucleotide amidohydrolase family protein [Leptospiraceae bacterium]HNF27629.1 nicotinamide-nucleotide amidohydrolase family protein [Leptospiraceae bacterium]HNH09239.1 nicotinamide-nucleotide amidohydrolase family protein [Leptospiraceae bacterium]